jgi:hypothetical protein
LKNDRDIVFQQAVKESKMKYTLSKRSTLLGAAAVLGLSMAAAPAMADHENHDVVKHEHHHYHHYDKQQQHASGHGYHCPHAGPAYQQGSYGYGQPYPPQYPAGPAYGGYGSHYAGARPSYAPSTGQAIGGALGGWAGSQIGKGRGNLAATALGAVLGYNLGGRW